MRSGERQPRGVGDRTRCQPAPRRHALINRISRRRSFPFGSEAGKGRHSPFLRTQGCGSGPRSVFEHRRGPLSVCIYSVSADPVDIARRIVSGKPVRTHPEQRAPVWLTAYAATSRQKNSPARRRGSWTSSSSCQLLVLAFHGLGIENDLAPDLVPALG